MAGPGIPGGVCRPDPFDYDPEDFTEEPIDHGDGGWESSQQDEDDESTGELQSD